MADCYVDNILGSDTNSGTFDSPVQTIAKAYTIVRPTYTGSQNAWASSGIGTIFAFPAIYRETLPNNIRLIGLGMVVIDGENIRECTTSCSFSWATCTGLPGAPVSGVAGSNVVNSPPNDVFWNFYLKNVTFRNALSKHIFNMTYEPMVAWDQYTNTALANLVGQSVTMNTYNSYISTHGLVLGTTVPVLLGPPINSQGGTVLTSNSGYSWAVPGSGSPSWQSTRNVYEPPHKVTLINCNFYWDAGVSDSCIFNTTYKMSGVNTINWRANSSSAYVAYNNTLTTVTYNILPWAGNVSSGIKIDKGTAKNVVRNINVNSVINVNARGTGFLTYNQTGNTTALPAGSSGTPTPNVVLNPSATLVQVYDTILDLTDTTTPKIKGVTLSTKVTVNAGATGSTYTTSAGPGAGFPINITSTPPTYRNTSFGTDNLDLSLAAGSGNNNGTYLRGGRNKSQIGGWYPALGFNSIDPIGGHTNVTNNQLNKAGDYPVHSGTEWITDPNYPDSPVPTLNVRAVYAIDPAVNGGGPVFEIDTNSFPAGKLSAVISPVWKVYVRPNTTTTLDKIIAEVIEDLTPSAGSRKSVDSSAGDSTKTAQYRASTTAFTQSAISTGDVPSWTDLGFLANGSSAFTQTFYIQLRFIMTLQGL
jgi:hypothetical protein